MKKRRWLDRVVVLATLGAGFTACDPGEPAQPRSAGLVVAPARDFLSGTRLRARYHVIAGLVEVFTTFHDTELDVDCAYDGVTGASHVGPNGSSYCLPANMAGHRENRGPYLDPACTTRGAFAPAGGPATYALIEPRNACMTAPAVHLVGPPQVRRVFLKDDSGACLFATETSAHAFTNEVPLSTFVHAEEQVERRAGRMGARLLVGDDGSRRVIGGFDRERGETSRVGLGSDGVRRWLPARTAFVGGGDLLFTEGSCATPVAAKIARTATCPLQAAVVLEGSCGAGNYFGLGEPVVGPIFQRRDDQTCGPGASIDLLAFRLGAPVAISAYEPVAAADFGSKVARRRGVGGSGDVPVAWAEVVAGVTNEPCEVVTTGNGTLRCLPAAIASVSSFSDPACTAPAFARTITGCEGVISPRFVTASGEGAPRVFEITAEIGVLYTVDRDLCVPFAPTVSSRMVAVREVELTRFPRAELAAD